MPLTSIQAKVLRLLSANRSPDSYLAGATVIHQAAGTPRYSLDLDFFHDLEESVAHCAAVDAATLLAAGHELHWLLRTPTIYRAVVTVAGEQLRLDWAQDSAFRFFPVQPDTECGYRLHMADAATGKLLALSGRTEARDFIDVLYLHRTYLPLGALAWAACGKDPGYTPALLLEHANRHACPTQEAVDQLRLLEPLDVKTLKQLWLRAVEEAQRMVESLPAEDLGCLYLDARGEAVVPDPENADSESLTRHFGSIRGAWPSIAPFSGPA